MLSPHSKAGRRSPLQARTPARAQASNRMCPERTRQGSKANQEALAREGTPNYPFPDPWAHW
eukprot:9562963-Lingulodinium_polyedra.AAC.1